MYINGWDGMDAWHRRIHHTCRTTVATVLYYCSSACHKISIKNCNPNTHSKHTLQNISFIACIASTSSIYCNSHPHNITQQQKTRNITVIFPLILSRHKNISTSCHPPPPSHHTTHHYTTTTPPLHITTPPPSHHHHPPPQPYGSRAPRRALRAPRPAPLAP